MAQRLVQTPPSKREFDGQPYILTKIDFNKADAQEDESYHKQRGRKVKIVEEDGFWLIYTKIGQ
ncbi:MAG: hypothetical protein ABIH70_00385 [Chloroflexota bacterium]